MVLPRSRLADLPLEVRVHVLRRLSDRAYFAAIASSPTLRIVEMREYNQRRWRRRGPDAVCVDGDRAGINYLHSIGELQPSARGVFGAACEDLADIVQTVCCSQPTHASLALLGVAIAKVARPQERQAECDALIDYLIPLASNVSAAWLMATTLKDTALAQRLAPNPGWYLLIRAIEAGALGVCYAAVERADRDDRSAGCFGLDTIIPWDILATRALEHGHDALALAITKRKRIVPCAIRSSLMRVAATHNNHAIAEWCLKKCPPVTSDQCRGAVYNLAHARDAGLLHKHAPNWPADSARWMSWARLAAIVGNVAAAEWLLARDGITSDADVVREIHYHTLWMALSGGHVHIVERFALGRRLADWQHADRAPAARRAGTACDAARLARLAALEPLAGLFPPESFVDAAAEGRRDACRLLCEQEVVRDIVPVKTALVAAVERGDLTMTRYLWRLPTSFPHLWPGFVNGGTRSPGGMLLPSLTALWHNAQSGDVRPLSNLAVSSGNLDLVRFLDCTGACDFGPSTMDEAAARGHLAIVAYLHHHRNNGCTEGAMARAAEAGHYGVVEFLAEYRSEGCPANTRARAAAHPRVVRLLRSYDLGA